jgi:hypothetical protein
VKNNNLEGMTALVTGASGGLGREFAVQLAAMGCRLVLAARSGGKLQQLSAEIEAEYGVEVFPVPVDLATSDGPFALFSEIQNQRVSVDILVNNAGIGAYGLETDIPWQKERSMLDLDIKALVHLTKLFLPGMVQRKQGYILQVASIAAFQPSPTYAAYGGAKSFVLSYSRALHYELKGTGVSCTVVSPGVTRTQFLEVADQKQTLFQRITMMEPPAVCRSALRALVRRKPSVVPGAANAVLAWSSRHMPQGLAAAAAFRLMTHRGEIVARASDAE